MANETALLLQGTATFVDDVRDRLLDGAAHAVFVRSQSAHALVTIDTAAASDAPGVLAVLTAADVSIRPDIAYTAIHPTRFVQPLLGEGRARFVGEPLAVVVAESRAQAIDAAELVIVEYEELPPVLTFEQAMDDANALFPRRTREALDRPENVIRLNRDDDIIGEHDAAKFAAADVVVHQRFDNPRQVAAPIECRAAAAVWQGDDVHVWMSTQTPHGYRGRIAQLHDLALSQIHVVAGPFVGGGFGGKGAPGPEEQLVPYLAKAVGRPVKWIESRGENLTAAPQGRSEHIEMWLAGSSDGQLQAVRAVMHKDAGAYPSAGAALPNNWSAPMLAGTYRIAHTEFEQVTYVTNRPPISALRGAGRAPIIAALERAIDLFAAQVGLDPAEVRRRNLLSASDMPYTSPTGALYDDADYADALERAVARAGYDDLRAEQARLRSLGGPVQRGIGIASYNHRTCGGGGESALVRINLDGTATVVTGTTSQGQGHEATWRKIASAELGIAPDQISVIEGVTDEISTGVGAVGSRSLQTAGLAIHEASAQVVLDAITAAADLFEAAPADVVLDRTSGTFHVAGTPSRSLRWQDIAVEMQARDKQLSCDHVYENNGRDVYPSGCHVAVVDVDTATGRWQLVRYVAVDDAGVRVNSDIVDGQLYGGIALGVAQVLGEVAEFDDAGNPQSTSFLDYQIASVDQFCQIELEAQVVPSSFNAGGYKAVGESGPIGATPAVHNAVLDAIRHMGVDHIDLPCTPQKVWQALPEIGAGRTDARGWAS